MLRKRDGHTFPSLSVCELWSDLCPYCKEFLLKSVPVALILFLVAGTWGQDGKRPSEPESPSILYYLDSSAQLVPLESQLARIKYKYRAWGFEGGTTVYQVEGEKSPVRLKAETKLKFVVRLEGGVDPLEFVQFYHFDEINGSRVVPIVDFDVLSRISRFRFIPATIDFNAAKYGASSFKIIPIQALAPGEYCLIVKAANKFAKKSPGFCFGVDATGS